MKRTSFIGALIVLLAGAVVTLAASTAAVLAPRIIRRVPSP